MTYVGYSVVELLIQISIKQLLSIANYRLDKVWTLTMWIYIYMYHFTYEIVKTDKESINCWTNILQAKSQTHWMMKKKVLKRCAYSLFFNNDNQAVKEKNRERERERKKRKPLISSIAVWLFTLGCCQKRGATIVMMMMMLLLWLSTPGKGALWI